MLYTLPKIHKPYSDIPSGRPIISAFVDFHLQPLVMFLPSYIRDTMDFIELINNVKLPDCSVLLVTMDVESLYTNVPFQVGLEAIKFFLDQRPCQIPSTACVSDLAKLVLSHSYFLFGSEYYLQFLGGSMDSKMKFTIDFHQEKINFLDVLVLRIASGIETTLYRKPTDHNTILQSCHPVSLKRSLPISQFSHIRWICSSDENFQQQSPILSEGFRK